MREIELGNEEWDRLTRRLMAGSADEALADYEPPIKLTHGEEYITFEKEGFEDGSEDNR